MGDYTDIEISKRTTGIKWMRRQARMAMGEAIAGALNKDLKDCAVYSRVKATLAMSPGTIGFATVRMGDIVSGSIRQCLLTSVSVLKFPMPSRMTFAKWRCSSFSICGEGKKMACLICV